MDDGKARLRKTFKYPSDDEASSDDGRDEMDDEEQEHLINSLQSSATKNDNLYRLIFTALPVATILPFLYYIMVSRTRSVVLPGLLGITSLCITTYGMWTLQTESDAGYPSGKKPSAVFRTLSTIQSTPSQGPLLHYLPYLNILLVLILTGLSVIASTKESNPVPYGRDIPASGFWLLLLLPAVVVIAVSVVKHSIEETKRGLRELGGMRYEFKGA